MNAGYKPRRFITHRTLGLVSFIWPNLRRTFDVSISHKDDGTLFTGRTTSPTEGTLKLNRSADIPH